jgi:hypothetical protein
MDEILRRKKRKGKKGFFEGQHPTTSSALIPIQKLSNWPVI